MKRLLRKLVQAETTTRNGELGHSAELSRSPAAGIISDELWDCGIDSRIDSPSAVSSGQSNCWDGNRANIVAQINPAPAAGVGVKSAGRKGALLFAWASTELSRMSHLDAVGPASNPPFAGIESEGKIYGRLPVLRQGLRLDERPDEQ